MAKTLRSDPNERTPIGERAMPRGLHQLLIGVTRQNVAGQVLAGVTLLAIAIPEQLATSQLAGVAAFAELRAFAAMSDGSWRSDRQSPARAGLMVPAR